MSQVDEAAQKRLFISYARADDEPFVERLVACLRQLGYEPWYDRQNMTNDGAPFTQAISDAIVRSSRLLLVVGPRSVASKYCKGEWETAQKHCIPVLPLLRLGDYDLIPSSIGKHHAVDMRASRDEAAALNELHRLLSDPVRPLTPVANGAPPLPDWFVPRPQYLEPLKQSLRVGDDLLALTSKQESVALQGIGGIGKTTLAAALCADCDVRRTFTRILWIELGPNADEARVINTMRAAVNGGKDEFDTLINARAAFARALHGQKTLIVLDDVWDGDLVKHYRIGGEDHRLLITTRQKGIIAQLGIHAQEVDRLSNDEALRLLNGRSGRSLSLDEARPIIDYLGGHSLALNLAGAWLLKNARQTPADLLRRLQRRAGFRDLALSQSDRNDNLELALRLSYDDLDEVQQAQFRALGALAGEASFDLAAARALWGLDDDLDAEDALAALRDAGLLDEGADGRCTQHPLLHTYARALAEQQGELAGLQARHFDHFFALHSDFEANQASAEDGSMLRHAALEADWDNIRAALSWGWQQRPRAACDWVWALQVFMMLRRSNDERLSVLDEALRAAQRASYPRGEANTLKALGDLSVQRSELEAARAYYDRALPLYETIGDRLGLANTLKALGDLSVQRSE
ncbi:MAG: NB-ARC domain-containing protein, partial [Aggregatilineales bacterium]